MQEVGKSFAVDLHAVGFPDHLDVPKWKFPILGTKIEVVQAQRLLES